MAQMILSTFKWNLDEKIVSVLIHSTAEPREDGETAAGVPETGTSLPTLFVSACAHGLLTPAGYWGIKWQQICSWSCFLACFIVLVYRISKTVIQEVDGDGIPRRATYDDFEKATMTKREFLDIRRKILKGINLGDIIDVNYEVLGSTIILPIVMQHTLQSDLD